MAKDLGIGVLTVEPGYVREDTPPVLNRKCGDWLRSSLNEKQKTYALAGNNKGLRWTPFQQTCENIRRAVMDKPGLTMKELLGSIRTHYSTTSTARSCIVKWAEAGSIDGIELKREGRELRIYPNKAERTKCSPAGGGPEPEV